MTLLDIESLAKGYADRRGLLADRLRALDHDLLLVKRKHMKELKRHVALVAETQLMLSEAIKESPDLFEKPKTRILHGIKVGFRKGKGKIEWEDDAQLVALIKKKFPDFVDDLILTTEMPSAIGLQELDAAELRKLGVTVEEAGEQVVVKAVETDVEKLVKLLLKGAMDEAEEAG
ncbi:MAG: hypothetical protein Q8K82_16350 [Gemmatimonadaceae bacterium]|nr:hypothetical protein [Gemmatimonadaceae bacterium]